VLTPCCTVIIWTYAYGGRASLNYFESAARIIPILVLAAALEGRRFVWASSLPTGLKVAIPRTS